MTDAPAWRQITGETNNLEVNNSAIITNLAIVKASAVSSATVTVI